MKPSQESPRISKALGSLHAEATPPATWKRDVLAAIEVRPARNILRWLVPAGLLAAVAAAFLLVLLQQDRDAERDKKKAAAELSELQDEIDRITHELNALIVAKDAEVDRLLAARDEQARAAAQRALDARRAEIATKQEALQALKDKGKSGGTLACEPKRRHCEPNSLRGGKRGGKKPDNKIKNNCDPADPLCGI